MNQEKINFRVARDFGETFNVSIKFLRQNFKLLFQSLLFIAGPFILISSVAGAFYQSNALNTVSFLRAGNPLAQFGMAYCLFIIAAIVANLVLVGVVYAFMIEYMEKGTGNFGVNDVAKRLGQNIGNILSVFFSLTIIMILIIAVIVGIFIGFASASPILAVLLAIALIIGMLILLPPLIWQLSAVYIVKMIDNEGPFDAFGKTRIAMKENFWWTWVIVVCSSIAIGIVSLVFTLPQAGYQMVLMFSKLKGGSTETSIPFLIVATICTFCSTLLYSALYIINAFHYFSLAEKKDGTGLMERINEIGQTPTHNVDQQY